VTTKSGSIKRKVGSTAILMLAFGLAILFLYLDRANDLSNFLQSLGALGTLMAVLIMAIIAVTPMPSEGFLIVLLKVYGAWWGILYSWIGAVLSSFVVFEIARHVGKPFLQSVITPIRFNQVDHWVKKRGTSGVFLARLLPIPGFIVSYILGTIPSVRLFVFVWTAAVSIVPYYVGAAFIYLGVSKHLVLWLSLGFIALSVFWVAGYTVRTKFPRGRIPD
jgi:uncharacterized membrane protein YdjX (TVP38/TMEM64 family)